MTFSLSKSELYFALRKKSVSFAPVNEASPILTITGSDSTSGSGMQADIRTISALGGYALSAVTSITVQTTLGIQQFHDIPAEIVGGQIDAVMNDFQPQIVKLGMIRTLETLDVIIRALKKYKPRHVILDAVVLSSRGDALVSEEVAWAIRRRLLPLCTLVIQHDETQMHGLANRYASAVAVYLSKGETAEKAQEMARSYISTQIARTSDLQGRGSELYNEFINIVESHHQTTSDVHFYADQLNVSSRYLAQVTRRISGKAPKTIIDEYLIQGVERQLATTDKTIQEIAYDFGFSSQAHFTKFFKKMRGTSPTNFRKQN